MKYFRILIILMAVLLTSCARSLMFEDKAVIVGVCKNHVTRGRDVRCKKYEVVMYMPNAGTFDSVKMSFLTDSLYSVGDTIYFSNHH